MFSVLISLRIRCYKSVTKARRKYKIFVAKLGNPLIARDREILKKKKKYKKMVKFTGKQDDICNKFERLLKCDGQNY